VGFLDLIWSIDSEGGKLQEWKNFRIAYENCVRTHDTRHFVISIFRAEDKYRNGWLRESHEW
jgi:hypothetical protein